MFCFVLFLHLWKLKWKKKIKTDHALAESTANNIKMQEVERWRDAPRLFSRLFAINISTISLSNRKINLNNRRSVNYKLRSTSRIPSVHFAFRLIFSPLFCLRFCWFITSLRCWPIAYCITRLLCIERSEWMKIKKKNDCILCIFCNPTAEGFRPTLAAQWRESRKKANEWSFDWWSWRREIKVISWKKLRWSRWSKRTSSSSWPIQTDEWNPTKMRFLSIYFNVYIMCVSDWDVLWCSTAASAIALYA